jgi:hypothetical protein
VHGKAARFPLVSLLTLTPWVVWIAAVAVAVAACGTARPGPAATPQSPATLIAQTGSSTATTPSAPGTLPWGPVPTDSGTGALNNRLLSHVRAPAGGADLPMGAGDLVEISVFEVEELSKLKLRIPMRWIIRLPLIGQIHAAGRTTIELEDDIRTRLEQKYMHAPQVTVFVPEHNSQRISVIGAVRRGGVYTMTSPLLLADALALAEGLACSQRRATTRPNNGGAARPGIARRWAG